MRNPTTFCLAYDIFIQYENCRSQEFGQIVVWTTFRTTTFSPSIKTTILALIFVKILQLQQSLFRSELFCQTRYSDEAEAKINFEFILVFLQEEINQNWIFYRNRLELVHGLDPSCAGANRLGDDLFSPVIAVHFRFRYYFIYFWYVSELSFYISVSNSRT